MKIQGDRPGFLWQAVIVFLILMDSIALGLSTFTSLKSITLEYLAVFDLFVSLLLLVLIFISLYKSNDRKKYIKKNWFLFFALVPFYFIAMVSGLYGDHILILKLLNLLKIYSLYLFAVKFAMEVVKYQEKTRLVYALAVFLLVLFICSFIFFEAEHNVNPEVSTYEDSLWFVLQTITTVGYGDVIPVTGVGRLMGVISMLSALVLTSIITSVATFSLIEKFRKGTEELTSRTKEQVDKLNKKMDKLDNDFQDLQEENITKITEDILDIKNDLTEIKELMKKR